MSVSQARSERSISQIRILSSYTSLSSYSVPTLSAFGLGYVDASKIVKTLSVRFSRVDERGKGLSLSR